MEALEVAWDWIMIAFSWIYNSAITKILLSLICIILAILGFFLYWFVMFLVLYVLFNFHETSDNVLNGKAKYGKTDIFLSVITFLLAITTYLIVLMRYWW